MRPSAFLNHPSFLLYMVLKRAGLCLGRLFASRFRVAKGVSVVNCLRVDLTVAWWFWYNLRRSVAVRAVRGALIIDILPEAQWFRDRRHAKAETAKGGWQHPSKPLDRLEAVKEGTYATVRKVA